MNQAKKNVPNSCLPAPVKKSRRRRAPPPPLQVQPRQVVAPRGWQVAQIVQTGRPTIQTPRGSDRLVVSNREFVSRIPATFTAGAAPEGGAAFALGFGVSTIFNSSSWLINLAKNYDKYRVLRFKLILQPILPVTTGGVMGMWFDSDPEATSAPATFSIISGNMNAKTSAIFEPMEIVLRPDQLNRLPQYLTTLGGAAPTVPDTALIGNVKIAWSSIVAANAALAGSQTIVHFWVDYDVEFLNPSNSAAEP